MGPIHLLRSLLLTALTVALLAGVLGWTEPADAQAPAAAPSAEQQIGDLEKQIEALTRKLNELRQATGKTVPTPAVVPPEGFTSAWFKALSWRSIGPATMGGRITALSVYEADPNIWYVATASGGLLKTVNNGVTFEHQFDREATVSIGDVCVAPSNPNIVWVGTGENNPRNSVSYGDGVYKSTDGGKTWKNMGLRKSYQIGKILIHPQNPDVVYVGALGRLYGPNEERGLFKTSDGGKSWDKVLYVDDRTGVIDMRMHPQQPDTLLVAMWERWRDGFDSFPGGTPPDGYDGYDPMKKWGPGAGIYKTTDGGKSWRKLTAGLPTNLLGRIGLDYYRKDPNVVYAVVDCEKIAMGPPGAAGIGNAYLGISGGDAEAGAKITQVVKGGPGDKAGLQAGDVIVALGDKVIAKYQDLVDQLQDRAPGDKVVLRLVRERESKEISAVLEQRPGAPPSKTRPFSGGLGGQRENIQAKQGKDGFQYGGVYRSQNGGESWERVNSLNPRPMYFSQVRVDPLDDRFVYILGIQLHRSSDGGRTFRNDAGQRVHADHHAMWIDPRDSRHIIVGGDGGIYVTHDRCGNWDFHNHAGALGQFYHVCVDSRRPYRVYGGLQDNGSWGGPSQSFQAPGILNEDWFVVGGGDGFVCRVDPHDPDIVYAESQNGNIYRRNLRSGEFKALRWPTPGQGKGPPPYRFNWNTPFILSHHNPRIFYAAGNHVFRSLNRGDDLRIISPEITRTKRGSATALAESPRNPDVLWAGSDDGLIWLTRDGGKTWNNVTPAWAADARDNLTPLQYPASTAGGDRLPGPRWVATLEPSRFVEGRCYAAFDAHRADDDEPYLMVTEDFGKTWKSIRGNLPAGSSRCLREDPKNPNLLFAGTEFAVFVSVDRGQSWHKLNNNLPTVAVHELAIHPSAGEMVAATHGRSLWVLDIKPLQQLTAGVVKAPVHLFEPGPAVRWTNQPSRGASGHRRFVGSNAPRGAVIYYSLAKKPDQLSLRIVDIAGQTVRELKGKTDVGLNQVVWDLTRPVPRPAGAQPKGPLPKGGPGGPAAEPAPPGQYRVILVADGIEVSRALRVEPDPNVPDAILTSSEEEEAFFRKVSPFID